jgi:hypothetical protein
MDYVLFNSKKNQDKSNLILNRIVDIEENPKIFLITDDELPKNNYTNINIEKLVSRDIFNLFKNYRVPSLYIFKELISKGIVGSFIHMSSDTILLKSYEEIKHLTARNKINITDINNYKLSYGYSYFDNSEYIHEICDLYSKFIIDSYKFFGSFHNEETELKILKQIQKDNKYYFNILPTLPLSTDTVFDPAGYGRFLQGQKFYKNKILPGNFRFIEEHIGAELSSRRLDLKITNNKISAKWNNQSFEISSIRSFWNDSLIKVFL